MCYVFPFSDNAYFIERAVAETDVTSSGQNKILFQSFNYSRSYLEFAIIYLSAASAYRPCYCFTIEVKILIILSKTLEFYYAYF